MSRSALVYARLSASVQDDEGKPDLSNVSDQLDMGVAYAKTRGYTVAETFRDDSVSAYRKKDRAGFEALLEAVKAGKGDVIVARHLDRLSRRRDDTARLFDVCEEHGVLLSMYTGQEIDLASSTGRMVASILMSVGQNEQDVKSERSKAAHVRRIKTGKPWWKTAPYGYTVEGKIVEDEAQRIREAVEAVLDGKSIRSICIEWNEAGHLTRRGKEWRHSTLTGFLRKPLIAGIMYYKGVEHRDVQAQWPGIIDVDTFDTLQVYLSNPERQFGSRAGGEQGKYLLSGIATDPEGRKVYVGTQTKGQHKIYKTPPREATGNTGLVTRRMLAVDEKVIDETLTVLTSPLMDQLMYDDDSAELIKEARKKLADTEKRRRELDGEYGSGDLPLKTYTRLAAVLDESEDKIKGDMLRARRKAVFADLDLTTVNTLRVVVARDGWGEVREAWDRLTLERQRAIIRELWGSIVVQPGRGKPVECFLREDL